MVIVEIIKYEKKAQFGSRNFTHAPPRRDK